MTKPISIRLNIFNFSHLFYLSLYPLDLAVIGGNKADKIKEDFPDSDYVIGGHSLGGVMASRYANKNHSDSHLKGREHQNKK